MFRPKVVTVTPTIITHREIQFIAPKASSLQHKVFALLFHKMHFISDFLQHVQNWKDLGGIRIGDSGNRLAPFFSSDSYWSYKTFEGTLLLLAAVIKARLVL